MTLPINKRYTPAPFSLHEKLSVIFSRQVLVNLMADSCGSFTVGPWYFNCFNRQGRGLPIFLQAVQRFIP